VTIDHSKKLIALLVLMAEQSGEKVSDPRMEFMVRRLLPLGADRVCHALEGLLETSRRFPTVAEVKTAMGITEQTDEDKGREVGERMWAALCRWGSQMSRWDEIAGYIGPIGVEVVKMQGGWQAICEVATNDQAATFKAQWRGLAAVLAAKGERGVDEVPDFTALPSGIVELADRFSLTGSKGKPH
jgi:hypothetical protein